MRSRPAGPSTNAAPRAAPPRAGREDAPAASTTDSDGYRLLALTEEELQRLVLDVHDGPVQYLFAALAQLTALRARFNADHVPNAYAAPLARAIECVEAALSDIRRTVSAFQAPAIAKRGLAGVIEELVVGHEARTGGRVDMTIDGTIPMVPLQVTITLYRIVQEALSNVERHSGVHDAMVRIWAENQTVCAEITDTGRGFDPPRLVGPGATELPAHIGLRGMRERVALVHGHLSVESRPGGGTHVRVQVPIDA